MSDHQQLHTAAERIRLRPADVTSIRPNGGYTPRAATLRELLARAGATCREKVDRVMHLRDTTTLVRLTDDASRKIDKLVGAGVFEGRSEATAFMVQEGIDACESLFAHVDQKLAEIALLRSELRDVQRTRRDRERVTRD